MPPLFVDDVLDQPPRPRRMVARALARRCPRCGARRLFHHWVKIVARCPGCGFPFDREEDSFFGAYVVNLAITFFGLTLVFIWFIARQDAHAGSSVVAPVAVGLVVCTLVPLACYPISRLLWATIELVAAPLEIREILSAAEATGEATDEPTAGPERPDGPDSGGGSDGRPVR